MTKLPTKAEILNVFEAQSETLEKLSERLVNIERSVEKQDSKNQNVVYAVLIAAILILVTIGAEVLLSNRHDGSVVQNFNDALRANQDKTDLKLNDLEEENSDLGKEIELLRAKNPYLK